jgi:hypothetical protein
MCQEFPIHEINIALNNYQISCSVLAWFCRLMEATHHLDFWLTLPNLGNVCGGDGVNVHPYVYVYTQQLKMLKNLI